MKLLLILSLVFSFSVYADDHENYYEPNVAEYYVSTFKDGKDMDDMMKWAAKWTKWAEESDA